MDLHCHLDLYPDPHKIANEVIKREIYVLSVTTTPSAWSVTNTLAKNSRFIRTGLGLHPQLASERHQELDLFERLLPQTRYVGEIGLDGSENYRGSFAIQEKVFDSILRLCSSSGGKILSIHSRGAAHDVVRKLKRIPAAGIPIFHWFSGTHEELQEAMSIGGWFSIGLPMLQSKKGVGIIGQIPKDKILLETDGPFSSLDGRPQLPWDVERISPMLAELWKVSEAEVKSILRNNLTRLTQFIG